MRLWNLIWWLASRAWTRWLARDFASLGADTVMLLPCVVAGADNIKLGQKVQIGPMCRMGALGGAELTIGDRCEIVGGGSFFAHDGGIEIGCDVLMAWNVQIYDSQHAIGDHRTPIREQGLGRGGAVRVGDGAWLGANVVVMQGVTIGQNAVIGANSVVTKSIPPHTVAVGAPARVIDYVGPPGEEPEELLATRRAGIEDERS